MSLISAGIDGLLAVCRAAPSLEGVQILDGDEVTELRPSYLVIGLDVEDAFPVDATSSQAGMAAARRRDVATIACLAWSSSGDVAMKPRREVADGLFDAVRNAVQADPRLGGAVSFAEIASYTYRPVRLAKGAAVQVEFRVQVTVI